MITRTHINLLGLLAGIFLLTNLSQATDSALPVEIICSPSTLVLSAADAGDSFTVHTRVAYGAVDLTKPIEMSGLAPTSVFADNRGYLVAKFSMAQVKQMVAPPSATLTLSGCLKTGGAFAGTDTIQVRK